MGFSNIKEIRFLPNRRVKLVNNKRPKFFYAIQNKQKKFIVAVAPGFDYAKHYYGIFRHVLLKYSVKAANDLNLYRYIDAENNISKWTNLDKILLKNKYKQSYVIGYIKEIVDDFSQNYGITPDKINENEYYVLYKCIISGKTINFLGVKFSFWGSISGKLCHEICERYPKEIIYIGKLGTLGSPNDIYRKIFSPSNYFILRHNKISANIYNLSNGFSKKYPEVLTGPHISVPTVIEEDYIQRRLAHKLKAESIDNEISQIASTITNFNRKNNINIMFSPIHFATDYLRKDNDKVLIKTFDLSNNRIKEAREKKAKILNEISQKLFNYFKEEK